jgi:multiple sugar transport system substrate-binding protein
MRGSKLVRAAMAAGVMVGLAGCGGSGFDDADDVGSDGSSAGGELTVLIGSSGEAETDAVTAAVQRWSEQSGTKATVNVASDLNQQLSQGFAGGTPPDLFYMSNDSVATYASNGSLEPFVESMSNFDDFYPAIIASYTYEGKVYAAPKDFSTLALVINTEVWDEAGLTEADVPTDWDALHEVALKLTEGSRVGLVVSPEFARVGVFLAQAGGWLTDEAATAATADSQANVEGLDYVKAMLLDGSLKYATDVGAGWGGEAFGNGSAAMTIEGNWITGSLQADYPDVKYRIVELPAGPGGKGTMQFNGGWAMAADSHNKEAAKDLVEYLTSKDEQLEFSRAFGPMPSVQSAADDWKAANPELVAFLDGAAYAKAIPNLVGITDVISDFNAKLQTLSQGDPATILATVQSNLEALIK